MSDLAYTEADLALFADLQNAAQAVLFGHYWMPGDRVPAPLAPDVACLDYSVAKEGRLCAYRWDGESTLAADRFISVPSEV